MGKDLGLNTRCVHNTITNQENKQQKIAPNNDKHGATRLPLYSNATFEFPNSESIAKVSKGIMYGHVYSRSSNPNIEEFENRIKGISKAMGVIATSSGMGAIALTIFSLLKSGDCFLSTSKVFGHTLGFFEKSLKNLNIEAQFVDFTDLRAVEKALNNSKIKMIFVEPLNNPWLEIADIKAISSLAVHAGIPLVVDSTMTPFPLFQAYKYGANIEIISSTKVISGGGGGLGGLVLDYGNFEWKNFSHLKEESKKSGQFAFLYKARKEIMLYFGLMASPYNAHAHCLGAETLTLRTLKACENAQQVAEFLYNQGIEVNYPALPSSPYYQLCQSQFNGYGGSVLTFKLDSKQQAYSMMNKLCMIKQATNIYDSKSLIMSPADVIYAQSTKEQREKVEIYDNMLRLALGIEDIADIIADIKNALADRN